MTLPADGPALSVLERMDRALNAHDIDAFVNLFTPDYRSEKPAHPDREFGGREQVRENWGGTFQEVPDFQAAPLRSTVSGDVVWHVLNRSRLHQVPAHAPEWRRARRRPPPR
jgi:ketosteroid isomerase-like protein